MTTALGSSAASRPEPARDVKLDVRSTVVQLDGSLLSRLPAACGGLAWIRDGQGLVGWGEAARLEVRGPDRFVRVQRWWHEQVERFVVDDPVGVPGSGAVAFATFTFDDESDEPSVVVVPRVILGHRDGTSWLTTIGPPPQLDSPQPVSAPERLRYSPGQMSVPAFRSAVADAVTRIAAGDLGKVVLAHDLLATAAGPIDPRFLLTGLAERYPDCWTFAVDGLVGATPELLVALHAGAVTARVLAGTTARAGDPDDDRRARQALLDSAKNRQEHRYAADSLVASLRPYCDTVAVSDSPYLLELSNVAHLATDVRGRVGPGIDVLDLVRAVHPTAAVGGTPSRTALDLIRRLEHMDRGRYAGPVGWFDTAGDGEWGIALRCAAVHGNTARLFAGCGIVADSDPDAEVAEARVKLAPVRDALAGPVAQDRPRP